MAQNPDVALAMDWGGTWCRIAVVSRAGEVLWQSRVRNSPGADKAGLLKDGLSLIRQAEEWCGAAGRVGGLGVAIAGPIDTLTGTLREPPNLPALDGVSLRDEWQDSLSYPLFAGNDADLAALGEFQYGAALEARNQGQACSCLVYVTVSTGIGGGVVEEGRMFRGSRGMAAEVGHMVLDRGPNAPPCQCGRRGCLEALASGTAIARTARSLLSDLDTDGQRDTSALAALEPDQISAEDVLRAAGEGDALAASILDGVLDSLSLGLSNLLHLYNPDLLVMGGGVSLGLAGMGLLPRLEEETKRLAMSDGHRNFRLVSSGLGDTPGMLGAASLAWSNAG